MRPVHNVAVIRCLSGGVRWSKSEHARLFDIIPLPLITLIIRQVIHRQGRQSGRFSLPRLRAGYALRVCTLETGEAVALVEHVTLRPAAGVVLH